jgi:hypothetical protein
MYRRYDFTEMNVAHYIYNCSERLCRNLINTICSLKHQLKKLMYSIQQNRQGPMPHVQQINVDYYN